MIHFSTRCSVGVLVLLALGVPTPGQEKKPPSSYQPGQFYKKPETAAEYWRAMNHEIELGQYSLAASYLKGFIAKNPSDEELLQIQDRQGSSAFMRLLTIPELRDIAKPLVERVDNVVQKHLSDRKRLETLITHLSGEPDEREYAVAQLRRSGALAMPALIAALLRTENDLDAHSAILAALPRLSRDTLPALVAALDVKNDRIKAELIDVIRQRGDTRAAPELWFPAAAPSVSETVRQKAADTLAAFLGMRPDQLPSARVALTELAERYYHHGERFADPNQVIVWSWDGKQLVSQRLPVSQAEEYFGLRYSRQALELDPAYEPAQVVFLSTALDKGFERAGLSQPLAKGAPAVKELLSTVNPALVLKVLDRGLREQRLPVILGSVRALGDLADVRAARLEDGKPSPLVLALNFPDRRVQMAAADALLRIPSPTPVAASRIVQVLARLAAADPMAKVLDADENRDRAPQTAAALRAAGFEPVVVHSGRDALHRLAEAADIDGILVAESITDPMLPYLLSQLRADVDAGRLPVVIAAAPDHVERLQYRAGAYRNVWVMAATGNAGALKDAFTTHIAQAMGQPLSEAERKVLALHAMEWLARLAHGDPAGYDLRPAESVILHQLGNKDLARFAVEAAAGVPTAGAQRALAGVALDPNRPGELRSLAAVELTRHLQQHGNMLAPAQVNNLLTQFDGLTDPKVKANVALVLGSLRPNARATGERLQRYVPSFAPAANAAPAPAPAKKENKEDKDGDSKDDK